ncbi:protein PHLOEM UNLOADING MODULATOR isoform X2 [Elaeis guineensis]|uniref:Uncharacterized protein LOC105038355 isoform X2 n=1 Tax=Elaeis guineensis var. tenera TaxID=51953 RepID=A0A6I9QS48_ELAGV|nr:uncharacterized protein LOC105038355 isoform X2 [Elaeis guineensis]
MRRPRAESTNSSWRLLRENGGLGVAAITYVLVDYLREVSPSWHERLQPALWAALALAALARAPFYRHWSLEIRAALPFLVSLAFLLAALLCEAISVRFVSAVLGLDWHRSASPLPDTGQWLLLALNEKLPQASLCFSTLLKLQALDLLQVRPWCASSRYQIPPHPHPWAQKYYEPYASDPKAIRRLIQTDTHYAYVKEYPVEYRPDWGRMSFLVDILRPSVSEGSRWYHLLKKASGGCNDLMYSGHMLVAVLTAMAWTEAYGGWTSALIWLLVLHSAQREVRERHHYSVDCIVAVYVGILLWRVTGFIWSAKDTSKAKRLAKLDEVQGRLMHAAKDSDIDELRKLLMEVDLAGQERQSSQWAIWAFAGIATTFLLSCILLAFIWTSDG